MEEFPLGTLSVEFVGDGLLLGEIGWDDSDDCGGVSGKILSVSASENADTREMVDDESYLRYINNIPNPGLAQQYTYSALGVTNSPYKRRGPPRGASLLLRNSAVISHFSFDIRYSIFGIRHSAVTSQTPSPRLSAIRVKVTRPELPHPSANFPWGPEANDLPRQNRPFKGWLRSRAYREARKLLDEEFKRYLGSSQEQNRPAEGRLPPVPSSSPPAPPANHPDTASPIPLPPQGPSPSPPQAPPSPPPRTPSSAFSDALTEGIFPDTPPQSSDSFHPTPPRGPSPTNSTDSVEFLEEIPPPPPRSYFRILESDTFESLISQFPRVTTASIPQGAYTIGPHYFDPHEIRNANTGRSPISNISPYSSQILPIQY
ncbi:PREDICTED: neural Wiskott-Aldrich syndrome protein-like [Trachymyrmex septentrionalis]|uniref:neural Wiskott-Aldrich syndrome protein-like n=1 Tax=Trachymyrmex septentrionalis TaxID=34720 RepID=UPI00084F743A|nr:PREDICTED: neural Wiskott-Aldrich syndrome protein-like [Trachymyrmex septentrionalis]